MKFPALIMVPIQNVKCLLVNSNTKTNGRFSLADGNKMVNFLGPCRTFSDSIPTVVFYC